MKYLAPKLLLCFGLVVAACSEQPPVQPSPSPVAAPADVAPNASVSAAAATPSSAVIEFGSMNTGSPFGPEPPHDQSGHGKVPSGKSDKIPER